MMHVWRKTILRKTIVFIQGVFASGLTLLLLSTMTASAADGWFHKPFQYVAVDQGLRDVLAEMAMTAEVAIDVSEAVHGQVHGRWGTMQAGEFLNRLCQTYGLVWYFDGSLLSVSTVSENVTRLLPLRGITLAQLREGMAAAKLMDTRFELRDGPAKGTAVIAGPPRFVLMAKQSLDAIAEAVPPEIKVSVPNVPVAAEHRVAVLRGSQSTSVSFR